MILFLLIILVIIHALGCLTTIVLGLWLPFCGVPIPVWGILGLLLVQMITDASTPCILTDLENYLRRKLGWPEIEGFVVYYFGNWWFRK